jgi:hypothetical protein
VHVALLVQPRNGGDVVTSCPASEELASDETASACEVAESALASGADGPDSMGAPVSLARIPSTTEVS